jgi:hypothetical protein
MHNAPPRSLIRVITRRAGSSVFECFNSACILKMETAWDSAYSPLPTSNFFSVVRPQTQHANAKYVSSKHCDDPHSFEETILDLQI